MKILKVEGKEVLLDDDAYYFLKNFNWRINKAGYVVCHSRVGTKKNLLLHRVINNTPEGMITDHINRNPLDNRKKNLRTCTHGQNMINRSGYRKSKSKYRGVSWASDKGKWRVTINVDGKKIHGGYYENEEEGALAYNFLSAEYHGDFSVKNKI
jgi:hypothetical protein